MPAPLARAAEIICQPAHPDLVLRRRQHQGKPGKWDTRPFPRSLPSAPLAPVSRAAPSGAPPPSSPVSGRRLAPAPRRCDRSLAMMLRTRPARPRRDAAAVVELALLLPFLLVVNLGIWEVGRLIQVQQVLNNAAREGARL